LTSSTEQLVQHKEPPRSVKKMCILLEANRSLIMPPRTIHYPYSCTEVSIVGNTNLMMGDSHCILQIAIIEIIWGDTTNEDPLAEVRRRAVALREDEIYQITGEKAATRKNESTVSNSVFAARSARYIVSIHSRH